jgi:UPF0271 protein
MITVDLNCDMGEGIGNDAAIMPFISSANIACGYHAGDADTMKSTVELALQHGVAVGAHPGFKDKANFGRTVMHLSGLQLFDLVTQQIFNLQKVCDSLGTAIHHIKPHGALYNMAAVSAEMSKTISEAIWAVNKNYIVYGLSGSCIITEANAIGLRTAGEVFADRTYQNDGTLTSRQQPNALITDENISIQQVIQMIEEQTVQTVSGDSTPIKADTVCIHGDGKYAVAFAQHIHQILKAKSIAIKTV